jgi:hypothetical protein
MDVIVQLSLISILYHLASLASGVALAYMGYRLFLAGLFQDAGELRMSIFRDSRLLVKKAAPGTFFAMFGVFIVFGSFYLNMSLWKVAPPVTAPPTQSTSK